jgi:vacuolar-type H+-ATPase subunit E/Vma4
MGVAAYNRGTEVVRRQIQADCADGIKAAERRNEREIIRDLQLQIIAERQRSEKAIRYMNLARAERDHLKANQTTVQQAMQRLRDCVKGIPLTARLLVLWAEIMKIQDGE